LVARLHSQIDIQEEEEGKALKMQIWHGFRFTGMAIHLVLLEYQFEALSGDCDICAVETNV
jgi:hypothetical protein